MSAPTLPGQDDEEGVPIIPVLQAQDGSFVGYTWVCCDAEGDDVPYMVAFDQNGGVRWTVANDQPQIATADGGVIGQSGIVYDSNGGATGQMGGVLTQSWSTQLYSATGSQLEAVAGTSIQWATGYESMAGGNPSANGTSIGVAESVEGLPVFALKFWGPSCVWQASGGIKVALGGTALTTYNEEKQQLLDGNYLTSNACSVFFNADPTRASFFSLLPAAVTQQRPVAYDGIQTNISQYDAGLLSATDASNPRKVSIFKGAPVCGQFVAYRGRSGTSPSPGKVTAAAQIHPPSGGQAMDVYINTKDLKDLTQATILHEALHNLTGRYDDQLEELLGLDPNGPDCGNGKSVCITNLLKNVGCAGGN